MLATTLRNTPEVLKALSKVVEGTPEVLTFEVANSTSHRIAARVV